MLESIYKNNISDSELLTHSKWKLEQKIMRRTLMKRKYIS